jgi:FixJ family two-component response regulator
MTEPVSQDSPRSFVAIVDDDPAIVRLVSSALEGDFDVICHANGAEAVAGFDRDRPGCYILDLYLPDMNGIEIRQKLVDLGSRHPFLVMSGENDLPLAVESMKLGAVDFVRKPFSIEPLRRTVLKALEADRQARVQMAEEAQIHGRLTSLTPREREVFDLMIEGSLTKNIASQLNISPKTVEVHRSRIMDKLALDSACQLAHFYSIELRRQIREKSR